MEMRIREKTNMSFAVIWLIIHQKEFIGNNHAAYYRNSYVGKRGG